ncbi:hypothetical protein NDU88_002204, partial [Pleurodeles waltl]
FQLSHHVAGELVLTSVQHMYVKWLPCTLTRSKNRQRHSKNISADMPTHVI